MKKRIGSLLLAVVLCLSLLPMAALAADSAWDGSVATAFAGGDGTESNPYQIADGAQLAYLASEVNKGQTYENSYFVLTADIDLANHDWTPIGNSFSGALLGDTDYSLFDGKLDGKGHTISNISIGTESIPLESDVFGLFGATSGKISNLNLDGVTICGTAKNVSGYVIGLAGALAGSAGGPIENCHVTNLSMTMNAPGSGMTAAYWIGGLVGALDGSQHIEGCSASGKVTEKSGKGSIGGLIGELGRAAKITYSHADVALDVKSDYYGGADVGGLIGKGNGDKDPETVISNCYAMGNVTGGAYSGGFTGSLWGLNIKNCYATGDVTGAFASMATFAGTDASAGYAYGSVTNCYTTGTVDSTTGSGSYAFAYQDATARSLITNCYFADVNSAIKKPNETAVPKTSGEMQTEEFKDTLNASDSANGWLFREGKTPICGAEPAVYSAVDAALAKIPADLTAYTDESIETLSAATESVIRGKVIAEQAEVDAMAKAIEDAVAALVKKPSSGGGPSSDVFFPVTISGKTENGTVTVSPKNAKKGTTVTITVTPDKGYTLETLTVLDKDGKEIKLTKKNDTQYTFTMPASKVEIKATFMDGNAMLNYFVDVKANDYFYDAVLWAAQKGITFGTDAEHFSPNQPCTRAQVITFLWRSAGRPAPKSASMPFTDVPKGSYYETAVLWAVENGITKGTSDTTFSPDATCSRAQIVTFLWRSQKSPAVGSVNPFTDVSANAYYTDAVLWAVEENITKGTTATTFSPDADCTRAQSVTLLYRAYVK